MQAPEPSLLFALVLAPIANHKQEFEGKISFILTAASGFQEALAHLYAFAAVKGESLTDLISLRLRRFVTPNGVGDGFAI